MCTLTMPLLVSLVKAAFLKKIVVNKHWKYLRLGTGETYH